MSDPPHSDSMGTHTDSGNETSNARNGPRDAFYFVVKNAELRYQDKVAIVEEVFESEAQVLFEGNVTNPFRKTTICDAFCSNFDSFSEFSQNVPHGAFEVAEAK